jgi:hypothetical protein
MPKKFFIEQRDDGKYNVSPPNSKPVATAKTQAGAIQKHTALTLMQRSMSSGFATSVPVAISGVNSRGVRLETILGPVVKLDGRSFRQPLIRLEGGLKSLPTPPVSLEQAGPTCPSLDSQFTDAPPIQLEAHHGHRPQEPAEWHRFSRADQVWSPNPARLTASTTDLPLTDRWHPLTRSLLGRASKIRDGLRALDKAPVERPIRQFADATGWSKPLAIKWMVTPADAHDHLSPVRPRRAPGHGLGEFLA